MPRGLPLLVAAVIVAGCGGDDEPGPVAAPQQEQEAVTVDISAVEGSGISGTATLTPRMGKRFDVMVRMTGTASGPSHPAHIHDVTCAAYAKLTDFDAQLATVTDSLSNVDDGVSETTVALTELSERTTGGYSINVHAPEGPYPAVACGDIPKR